MEYKNETSNDVTWWEKWFTRGLFYTFYMLLSSKSKVKFTILALEAYTLILISYLFYLSYL